MKSNFDKFPVIKVTEHYCLAGWQAIANALQAGIAKKKSTNKIVVAVECYQGVDTSELQIALRQAFSNAEMIDASSAFKPSEEIEKMVYPYATDDLVFGYITPLTIQAFFDAEKISVYQKNIADSNATVIVYGTGAALIASEADILVYADMPRWEIQLRFRKNSVGNLAAHNPEDLFAYQYKRAFFVDWRVLDRHKKTLMNRWDFLLDTTIPNEPKLLTADAYRDALERCVHQPFRLVPFFDPGPWGGQWLKEVIDLDRSAPNYAWGFDCVPEENSLLFRFNDNVTFETPAINLIFTKPKELLGKKVHEAFGEEFPIRFDFLDTISGGNLSLQVHPLKEYIREQFGMAYTQDESYYILDAKDDAFVYLGLKENIVPAKMIGALETAQEEGAFEAEEYVEKWPVKKHDHVLIPSGTVHCSGADTVVLEISATPYIFTFKLWDWGRMGLDGKPRPISLAHGKEVIQWNRTAQWTKANLINQIEPVAEGDGWREERTGLDATSFIETRRHWFTQTVAHNTNGVVNVLNLIEGREAIVESPSNAFEPYIIHYAETFIVPAEVGAYTLRPHGESEGKQCATMKAYIRTENLIDYRIN